MPASRFLIVETGRPLPPLGRHGGFPHWIRTAAGLSRAEVDVVDATAGAWPAHGAHAGVLVTGSGAMVSDRLDWSERAAAWLRGSVEAGVPAFGICYGHQLLAHALGGRVGDNPLGREMGTVAVRRLPGADGDPLFHGVAARFDAHATHLQTVLEPPGNAVVLACSALDRCQALRFGEAAWGVQFHPEFSVAHMQGYIRARAGALVAEGADPGAMLAAVHATPAARRILRRFVAFSRRRARGALG
jgi:GMP synthase (glutamine-hydrolysing)